MSDRGQRRRVAAAGSASAASWAWINACSTDDPSYFRLRYASLQRWQVWMQQLGGIRFTATETFLWDLAPDELRAAVEGLSGLGYPVELIDGVAISLSGREQQRLHRLSSHTGCYFWGG